MKKTILFFLLFLLSISYVSAEHLEEVKSVLNYSGTHFYVDSKRFDLGISKPQNKISLAIEDIGGVMVYNNTCSDIGNYSICLKNIVFGYHNYSTDVIHYKASVEVNQYVALLSALKEVSKTELLIGDSSRVTITLKNEGSVTASDCEYKDDFPGFEISDVSGCNALGTEIR
jgi:hypothetical protein